MWSKLRRRAALSCLAIALMLSLTPFHASNTVVQASTANLIHEDFSVDASRFAAVSGGTWSVSGGRYALTSAANGVPLGNVSVHQTEVEGDFTLSALGHVADATAYDDFAIVFGYQDANNYYYVSFNEFNDASTHGIFKVAAGTKTELADLGAVIAAGTDYGIEIERAGSDIAVYLDGTLRASVSDSAYLTGKVGFGSINNDSRFDDLIVRTPVPSLTLIDEDFSIDAYGFVPLSGGKWTATGGRYVLTSAANATTLGNISLHRAEVWGDFTLKALGHVSNATAYDDFAIVFGYQDADNYYFASFNEYNDGTTHGIFKMVGGTRVELADFSGVISAGTDYRIEIARQGNDITVSVDGAAWASASDSAFPKGRVGMGSINNGSQFDDFVVQVPSASLIEEDFSVDASRFTPASGGTWAVSGGTYTLTSAANAVPLGNVSVHRTETVGDFALTALGRVSDATAYDDFAIVFGYQDAGNYYYASFNEYNDGSTHGIFKVEEGIRTELADFVGVIAAGTDYEIEIVRSATVITVYVDGVKWASARDDAFMEGKTGFGSINNDSRFDNLTVQVPVRYLPLVYENFSVDASNFTAVSGGIWSVADGKYTLTSAANAVPLGNMSVHQTVVTGDFTLTALGRASDATPYDDFAIVFGYQDAGNYYYASFNEYNDGSTHGLFKVADGTKTELADFDSVIDGGTDYSITVARRGNDIGIYVDGSLRASVSDGAFASGKVGVGSINNAVEFDDLLVVVGAEQPPATWRSTLYPENWQPGYTDAGGRFLHDWSYAGYRKGEEDIPNDPPGLIYNVAASPYFADGSGTADSTGAIQQALDDAGAAGGGIVYLPAGTYKISLANSKDSSKGVLLIERSGVVLRGAGVGKTFLLNTTNSGMRYRNVIHAAPVDGPNWAVTDQDQKNNTIYWSTKRLLTQDAPELSTVLHVNDASGYQVDDDIFIGFELTADWIAEHGLTGVWDSTNMTNYDVADETGGMFSRTVTAVDTVNDTITVDIPIRYWLKTRDKAMVWKHQHSFIAQVGIEDLSMGNVLNGGDVTEDIASGTYGYDIMNAHNIMLRYVKDGWVRRVATYNAGNPYGLELLTNGIKLEKSRNVTIQDTTFRNPQHIGDYGNGYLYTISGNDNLLERVTAIGGRHNYSFGRFYSAGNVIFNSVGKDSKHGPSDFHMFLSPANLIDGMHFDGDYFETMYRPWGDPIHGHTSTQTAFWNIRGDAYYNDRYFIVDSRQYQYGYVIGTSGLASKIQSTPTDGWWEWHTDTAPEDFYEGVGQGKGLQPQSLYLDQKSRRLGE